MDGCGRVRLYTEQHFEERGRRVSYLIGLRHNLSALHLTGGLRRRESTDEATNEMVMPGLELLCTGRWRVRLWSWE